MKILKLFILASLFVLAAWAQAQEKPSLPGKGMNIVTQEEIKPLTTVCESCHGIGGNSSREDVPVIAGRSSEFIMSSLEQFYYYERHCPNVQFENYKGETETKNMCDVTNALTEQEGLALAKYFSDQKPSTETGQ